MNTIKIKLKWGWIWGMGGYGYKIDHPRIPHLDGLFMGRTLTEVDYAFKDLNQSRERKGLPLLVPDQVQAVREANGWQTKQGSPD